MKNLKALAINVPSDEHLAFLAKLPHLECLRLYGDHNITDSGMKYLRVLTWLQELSLTDTHITDSGLHHLKALSNLRSLDLNYMNITDTGLDQLAGLNKLQWLNLTHTRVTKKGVAKLQQALPKCRMWDTCGNE